MLALYFYWSKTMTEENKLIIDGKDYGNDHNAYNRAYNNKLRDMFIYDNEQENRSRLEYHAINFKRHQKKIFWQNLILSSILFAMVIATIVIFTFNFDTSLN